MFLGSLIVKSINKSAKLIETLGLGFFVGHGLYSLMLFLLLYFGLKPNIASSVFAIFLLITVSILSYLLSKSKTNHINTKFYLKNKLGKTKPLLYLILLVIALSLVSNIYWPPFDWDSVALYDMRALKIIEIGSLDAIKGEYYYLTYPFFTTMSHLSAYVMGAKNPSCLYTIYLSLYLSCLFCVYKLKSLFPLVLIVLNTLIFQHSTMAYTNLPYTIYFTLSVAYLYKWLKTKTISYLYLSSLLLPLSYWTRSFEPFWILPILCVLYMSIRNRQIYPFITYTLPLFVVMYFWKKYLILSGIPTGGALTEYGGLFSKLNYSSIALSDSVKYIVENLLFPNFLLIIIYIASTIIKLLKNKNLNIIDYFIFGIVAICFAGAYLYRLNGIYDDWIQLGESYKRISMIFVPLFSIQIYINIFKSTHE